MDTITHNKSFGRQPRSLKIFLSIGSFFIAALLLWQILLWLQLDVGSKAYMFISIMVLAGAVVCTVKSDNDTMTMLIALPLFITGYVLMFLSGFNVSLIFQQELFSWPDTAFLFVGTVTSHIFPV